MDQLVEFPTLLPIPISFWIETVLPKHGHLVKKLVILLADSFLPPKEPSLPNEIEPYENTDVIQAKKPSNTVKFMLRDDYYREALSLGSMFSLVKQCPNLEVLLIDILDQVDK